MTATTSPRPSAPEHTPVPATGPALAPLPAPVSGFLTRAALFARPLKTLDGEIPDVGKVRVRELKQSEREALDDSVLQKTFDSKGGVSVVVNNLGFKARATALALVHEDGSPFFLDATEGATALGEMPSETFNAIFALVDDLNKLTAKAQTDAGKVFGATGSESSSSTSPTNGAASPRS